MRNIILFLSLLVSSNVFGAVYDGPISKADFLTHQRLAVYLEKQTGEPIESISAILQQVDEDNVEVVRVKINNQIYEMVIVAMGDTEAGALFTPGTIDMVGEMSDGNVFMYTANSEDGEFVEDIEFL